jgi:hypothetical protein
LSGQIGSRLTGLISAARGFISGGGKLQTAPLEILLVEVFNRSRACGAAYWEFETA